MLGLNIKQPYLWYKFAHVKKVFYEFKGGNKYLSCNVYLLVTVLNRYKGFSISDRKCTEHMHMTES